MMCLTVRLLKRAISVMPRFFLSPVFKDYEPWRVCFCTLVGFGLFVQSENASLADKQVLRSLHRVTIRGASSSSSTFLSLLPSFQPQFSCLMVPVTRGMISQGCARIVEATVEAIMPVV